jgi:hypothetical protein
MRLRGSRRKLLASGIAVVALFLVTGIKFVSRAESQTSGNEMSAKTAETTQEKYSSNVCGTREHFSTRTNRRYRCARQSRGPARRQQRIHMHARQTGSCRRSADVRGCGLDAVVC